MQFYFEENNRLVSRTWTPGEVIPENVFWIDLLQPTREEEKAAEVYLGIEIPTREEMSEIEVSNRLYEDNDALYMTASMITKVDTGAPETHAVTFIVQQRRLVTVRYVDTTSFRRYGGLFLKMQVRNLTGAGMLLSLIEAIINRQADILERVEREIDKITRNIFMHRNKKTIEAPPNYQLILENVGRCGDITAKIHESMATFSRVIVFASHHSLFTGPTHEPMANSIRRDIAGLSDHGTYLAGRVNFVLDATLGMISIEQNGVFKVLAVASLVLMPPTLIAGIYGMNFRLLPELNWHYGYLWALGLMLFFAILPLAYLKQRKWL